MFIYVLCYTCLPFNFPLISSLLLPGEDWLRIHIHKEYVWDTTEQRERLANGITFHKKYEKKL